MHFHEVWKKPIQDYERERQKLEILFAEKRVCQTGFFDDELGLPAMSLMEYLEDAFQTSHLRGTAMDIHDFFLAYSSHWVTPGLNGLLFYCETLLSVLWATRKVVARDVHAKQLRDQIQGNIHQILEQNNLKTHLRRDGFIEIIQKDALESVVVGDLTEAEVVRAVLEYAHFSSKGNLDKKRELLVVIGRHVEPILQDSEMNGSYKWLIKDLGCCLNSLHIRHNNKSGDKANAVAQAMSDAELEACYDGTYRELLLLIELQKNLPFHRKVKGLKGQLDAKKDGRKG